MHTTRINMLALFSFLLAAMFIVACGSNGSRTGSNSTGSATSSGNNTPDNSGYYGGKYGNGGGQTTPTANSSNNEIKTANVTVSGKSETVLTNAQGMTLYYRTSDAPPTSVCSGGCASAWPPLVATGSSTPTSSASLPGKLSVQTTDNGKQVEYNGHPLYTFSGDSGPGQTNGEGIGGVWHVVTPDLP